MAYRTIVVRAHVFEYLRICEGKYWNIHEMHSELHIGILIFELDEDNLLIVLE